MSARLVLLIFLIAGCSKGPEADLPYISNARSLGSEWALVNEQASAARLTQTYARIMRQSVREQLQTAAKALTQPDSRYAAEIRALLAEPDEAAPEELRAHVRRLKHIEDSLESA